jgi:hypothetical protein
MESSPTLLRLGHIRATHSHRSISRSFSLLIPNTTRDHGRHILPVLLPLPTILHLRNIRLLLDSKMANLPMERRMGLPRKIPALPRRILLYHPRTIRQRRDHQRTIRTDDARPTTTQLTHKSPPKNCPSGAISLTHFFLPFHAVINPKTNFLRRHSGKTTT